MAPVSGGLHDDHDLYYGAPTRGFGRLMDAPRSRRVGRVAYHRVGADVAPIAFAGLVAMTALYRPLYRVIINEDALVEWAQLLVLVALVPMGLALAVRLWRRQERMFAALFTIAAIGAFFIAGEEISWGQRILGLATPGDLADINQQGETNVHNIGDVSAVETVAEDAPYENLQFSAEEIHPWMAGEHPVLCVAGP